MITLPLAAALTAAILSTSFISGIFGMAGGMILMGILLAIMPVAAAMVLHGVTQMASNGWRAWLWRTHIRWPIVASYAAGAVLAALAFTAAQVVPSKPVALIIIGLTPFVGLVLPSRVVPDPTRRLQGVGCGAICTVLLLLAGVSGPIFDVFFVRSRLDRKEMIATKGAIQVFGHFLKVAYFGQFLAVSGAEVAPVAVVLALALPAVGTHLSRRVLDAMSDAQFRRWTRGLIVAIAAVYLAQGLYGLLLDLGGAAAIAATLVTPRS
ncbi:MAG: TSUP family transporter [Xanthobacteraceae bacterium]